jgi:hypothetical protein
MLAALSAVFFAVSANAQAASQATTQDMVNALMACQQPLIQALQSNQACSQQSAAIASSISGTDPAGLIAFCSSTCLPLMNNGYRHMGTCMQAYTPKLTSDLTRDGVANPASIAATMTSAYLMLPEIFNLMCTRNDRGDFCMPLFSRMGTDIAASGSNLPNICNVYYNTGCCLSALDHLYQTISPSVSFVTSLSGVCPNLVNFNPPACVTYGQISLALTLIASVNDLNCGVLALQDANFRIAFEVALRQDLATQGVPFEFISVTSITDVGGVCTITLVIRANTDDETRGFQTAAATLTAATFTQSNAVLLTVPETASDNITMQLSNVSFVNITGQSVGTETRNSGLSVVPGFVIAASFAMMMFA